MRIDFTARGLYLPDLDLWLDPTTDCRRAWISHAHRDHAAGVHRHVYATPETIELYLLRYREAPQTEFHPVAYGCSWSLEGARLTAYPAAHILGAAQLLIEWRGERMLYTGDIKLRPPWCGRQTELVRADRLVMESTFGLPVFHFCSREEARERVVGFARECLAEGLIPVFLTHELGRGQELTYVLCQAGVPTAVAPAVARFLPVYAAAGFSAPGWTEWQGAPPPGHACVAPTHAGRSGWAADSSVRIAYVSGWAALDNARARTGAEELIPYSDHADFEELLELVEAVGAREIDVVHGYAEALARILTLRGRLARAPIRQEPAEA